MKFFYRGYGNVCMQIYDSVSILMWKKGSEKRSFYLRLLIETKHTEIEWDLLILSRSLAPEREKGCMIMNRKSEMSIGITNGRWISLETINPI